MQTVQLRGLVNVLNITQLLGILDLEQILESDVKRIPKTEHHYQPLQKPGIISCLYPISNSVSQVMG